ncbi:MAG: RagB/SusD family nutrient uptake outer membrane protein [Reichenbachiella sp.]
MINKDSIMKNISKYILTTALIFIFSACKEDFLEFVPEDEPSVGAWYNDEAQIKATTSSLYGRPWFTFNDKFSWAAGDGMSGDLYQDYQDEGQLFFFSFNENNGIISQAWAALFNVVSFSNSIIDDMPGIAAGNGVSQDVINAGLGEARFMRAMAYYFLVENFGEVPIVERPAERISSNDFAIPKNTVSDIYRFIREDLEFAKDNLPNSDEPGRVTSWSAKGMLAKIHVTLGQMGSDADFAIAAGYANDVINNSGLALMSSYEDLFLIENNNNSESLFALQWVSGAWGTGNSRQAVFARHSVLTGNGEAWGGGKCMTKNFTDNVTANANGGTDLRARAIYMSQGDHYPYIQAADGGHTYDIVLRDDEDSQLSGQTPGLNSLKKYVVGSFEDVGVGVINQATPLNQYMLRLADVYLLLAEAMIGSGASTTDGAALAAFNAVRMRAGLAPDANSEVTYEEVFNERRVELGLEGLSWLEVKRRYHRNGTEAIAYLNGQSRNTRYYRIDNSVGDENDPLQYEALAPGESSTLPGSSNVNESQPVVVTDGFMTLPVPANEVVTNPLLAGDVPAEDYPFE